MSPKELAISKSKTVFAKNNLKNLLLCPKDFCGKKKATGISIEMLENYHQLEIRKTNGRDTSSYLFLREGTKSYLKVAVFSGRKRMIELSSLFMEVTVGTLETIGEVLTTLLWELSISMQRYSILGVKQNIQGTFVEENIDSTVLKRKMFPLTFGLREEDRIMLSFTG